MRLFIAAPVPKEVREHCIMLEDELRRTGVRMKTVEPENIHITMKFLGDVSADTAKEIIRVLDKNSLHKANASTTRIGVFPSIDYIKIVWLGIDSPELVNIHTRIDGLLSKLGFKADTNFVPHITLSRVKEKPNKNLVELIGTEDRLEFIVDKLLVMKSILTKRGPIYEVLYEKQLE